MPRHFEKVSIIGAGIAGAALAIELTQYRIIPTLYESRDEFYSEGGSMVLCANACRALDRLGVYHALRETSYVHEIAHLRDISGNLLGGLILGDEERFGYPAIRNWRHVIRRTLLEKAKSLGVKVRYGMRLMSIVEETEDYATMAFENGEIVRTDLVIGANGIQSNIREYFNPGSRANYTGQTIVLGFAPRESLRAQNDEDRIARMILDKSGSFAYVPVNAAGDTYLFFSTIEMPDRPREEWRSLIEDKQMLKKMLQEPFSHDPWPDTVKGLVTESSSDTFMGWPCDIVPDVEYLSRWGRVIIIGDAAHAIPPSVGQGGAISIEDACTLGIAIRHVNMNMITEGGLAAMDLLRRWERHRKARVARVTDRTKMGSNLRRAAEDDSALLEKGKRLEDSEKDLSWLYGYDVEDVEKAFVV